MYMSCRKRLENLQTHHAPIIHMDSSNKTSHLAGGFKIFGLFYPTSGMNITIATPSLRQDP